MENKRERKEERSIDRAFFMKICEVGNFDRHGRREIVK